MKITKRQLLRLIREEAETIGVNDESFTADNFGGGEVAPEPFVDVEEEALLNQNSDPGVIEDIEVIPETKKLRMTKRQLRRIIREQAGGGLPSVDDLAKKLGAAGPEAAIDFIRRLLDKANFVAPEPEVLDEPAAASEVIVDDEVDPAKDPKSGV